MKSQAREDKVQLLIAFRQLALAVSLSMATMAAGGRDSTDSVEAALDEVAASLEGGGNKDNPKYDASMQKLKKACKTADGLHDQVFLSNGNNFTQAIMPFLGDAIAIEQGENGYLSLKGRFIDLGAQIVCEDARIVRANAKSGFTVEGGVCKSVRELQVSSNPRDFCRLINVEDAKKELNADAVRRP
jgi:hypothetical protein